MNEINRRNIYNRFPKQWFPERFFELAIGDGWYELFYELCEQIEKTLNGAGKEFAFLQVKQKFGGLRIYVLGSGGTDIEHLISLAESKANKTCEECGKNGEPREENWNKVLCDDHAINKK
jgi:hypothetical protein